MKALLEAEGLRTYNGKSHILHGVGLTVRDGEIVTLPGSNGVGKTTTLRNLMGPQGDPLGYMSLDEHS
ncbi:MAG: ATP-binding cassette domain-containing protein [Xanthobacteraceae bacterium]